MTPDILRWGKEMIYKYQIQTDEPAIELGAKRFNPDYHAFRDYFTGQYIGVDQENGLNVNLVSKVADLRNKYALEASFKTVVCTEMLEHDLTFWVSLDTAYWLLEPGGYILLTTCGYGFPLHNFPSDYYRFTEQSLLELLEYFNFTTLTTATLKAPDYGPTVCAVGRK